MPDLTKQRTWRHQMKRLQHYLSVKSVSVASENPLSPTFGAISSSVADDEPRAVLVSIDVEAFELDQSKITEVGLSVLDCADIHGTPAGSGAQNWIGKIITRHFIVTEYKHLVNKRFVEGCPDKFMFGESEQIGRRELVDFLRAYFSELPNVLHNGSPATRKVILVGHSVQSDVKYLQTLGFDPTLVFFDTIDTVDLERVACRNARQRGLVKLLEHYNLPRDYLHNAGNDACYTLQVAIAIALDTLLNKKTPEFWELERQARVAKAIEDAIAKTNAEFDGWSSADDDDDQVKAHLSRPAPRTNPVAPTQETALPLRSAQQSATHSNLRPHAPRFDMNAVQTPWDSPSAASSLPNPKVARTEHRGGYRGRGSTRGGDRGRGNGRGISRGPRGARGGARGASAT